MECRKSIASLLIFVGSALCFFLPFMTVSCGGIKAFTLTGQQLATGTTLTQPQPFGPPQTQKVAPDPFAAIAGLCALVGIVLCLIGRKMAGPCAATGGLGAVSLLIMRARLDAEIQKQSQGLAAVSYETGFTLVLLLFFAGLAWNVFLFFQGKRTREAGIMASEQGQIAQGFETGSRGSPPQSQGVSAGPSTDHSGLRNPTDSSSVQTGSQRFCTHCGQAFRPTARFCEACGSPSEMATSGASAATPANGGTV
jgi:hypothetical protein